MRDIKFRAWDKLNRKMRYFDNHKDGILYQDGKLYASTGWDSEDEPTFGYGSDAYDFEQYTGLKDKNGREIYEGDVAKDTETGKIYKIVYGGPWNYAGFGLTRKRDNTQPGESVDTWDTLNPEWAECIEVLGNIHDNPELLK